MLLLLPGALLTGQNLLDQNQEEIKSYVSKNYPNMILDKDFKNDHYKYLKFTDDSETRTMLFFIDDRDRCSGIRIIYEPELKKEVIADLNKKYRYVGENLWFDGKSKIKASVKLTVEDWFVTVNYTPVKSD